MADTSNLDPGQGSQRPLLRIRSNSMANERSLSATSSYTSLISQAPAASPEPAFIATSAASQIVTNDHDHHADNWLDEHGMEPSGETALVAPGALKLVNGFLDQLLFSFIAASKSTSLAALRPAVTEVLKPKLAKEAINGADQELHDYLGTGDDEELLAFHSGLEPSMDWDPEKVWKRTRLRCMVYSSLGDMEEEDEDYHVEQQQLDEHPSSRRFSKTPFVVSPAVAIFLTSILEFMGEQALVFAGQHAYHRLRTKREKELKDGGGGESSPIEIADRVVVEECDMEKVALDRTLGRLWRGWRKRLRSPATPVTSRSISRDSYRSRGHSRSISSSARIPIDQEARRPSILTIIDQDMAASIPLPMTEDDVREIEIPGLAYSSEDSDTSIKDKRKRRPKSSMMFFRKWDDLLTPDDSLPQSPMSPVVEFRKRSNSLPTPVPSPYAKWFQRPDVPTFEPAIAVNELDRVIEKGQGIDESQLKNIEDRIPEDRIEEGVFPIDDAHSEDRTPDDRPMSKDSDILEQYFVERPQIMTSHRVSMGGMTPDSPISPRPTSVRSLSVHSIRLIDVPSRSPARANHGFADATTPTLRSPPSPFLRNTSALSTKTDRNSTESIAEVAEPDSITAAGNVFSSRESAVTSTQGVAQASPAPTLPEPKIEQPELPRPSFVLAPAPAAQKRVPNGIPVPDFPTRNNFYDLKTLGSGDSGVPPLTPLREMMEGAADTSDEASSIAPSNDSRKSLETQIKGHTPNISVASVGQPQRSEQHRRPVPAERSSNRARKDSLPKHSSEIVNRSHRSVSQSSSATSYSNKVKVMRTSSDYGDDGKGKSFEELIRSDQTIQYTLTPQNMREIEVSLDAKTTAGASAKKVAQSTDSLRVANSRSFSNESSNGSTPPRPNTGKSPSSVTKFTSLHSNPPSELSLPKPFQPIPRPVSNHASRVRPGAPQPRDARIERESIGDFAEFIRSTGPTGLSRPPPRSSPAPSSGRSVRPALSRNASASFSRAAGATPVRRSESSAGRTRLMARDAKLPPSDNNSDLIDFIRQGPPSENTRDNPRIPRSVAPFRSTMDSDQMVGAVGGRPLEQVLPDPRNSQTSTNISESMHSSVNSQSALLNGTNPRTVAPARSYNSFDQEDMMPKRKTRRVRDPYAIDFSDEEEELLAQSNKKPQRQEESLMDFLNNVPPPPSSIAPSENSTKTGDDLKKKSSRGLMSRFTRTNSSSNFTTDAPPPSYSANSHPPRASTGGTRLAKQAPQLPSHTPMPKRAGTSHSSASTIRAASSPNPNASALRALGLGQEAPVPPQFQFEKPASSPNPNASALRALGLDQQEPVPSQFQFEKPKSYQPARGNYVSQLDTERKPPSTASTHGNRVVQRSYQPREARQESERTNELAAFLASAPPPTMAMESPTEPFLLSESTSGGGGGFSRMFRKKKAVGGYA